MLQQLINWILGKDVKSIDTMSDKDAVKIIERSYLQYKSRQRIQINLDGILTNLVKDIYTKPIPL